MSDQTMEYTVCTVPMWRSKRVLLVTAAATACGAALLAWHAAPGALPAHWLSTRGWSPGLAFAVLMLGLACEYVDSSLGMGYGTTLTPLLLLLGFEPLSVVPAVLCSELLTGVSAVLMHQRDGNIDLRGDREARGAALTLSALSTAGAVAAVLCAVRVSKAVLGNAIAVIIIAMGVITLGTLRRRIAYRRWLMVLFGGVAAFNKGLSGGGYGPMVTAGQVVSGLAPRKAVAITSLAEAFTCLVSIIAYLVLGKRIDVVLAGFLCTGALMSVPLATMTVRRIPESGMRAVVGIVTCALGALALLRAL